MTATCSPLWSMTLPATSLKHQGYIPFYWVTLKVNSTAVGYLQDLSMIITPLVMYCHVLPLSLQKKRIVGLRIPYSCNWTLCLLFASMFLDSHTVFLKITCKKYYKVYDIEVEGQVCKKDRIR